ncbi:DUF5954 family protein [Micromonospora narathiwatensis]|uniref:LigA protein n=1 Tax=Micromonospora narathiwatensis TaxID=299146 RepID=A0A1A8Z5G5_9ACTN|nr:DUF5954 family protein [Micromonospora narathiwatensis]SBT39051.1 hypothetical protein GA0070621_0572 [Micromonospora narathiwatensis]
MDNGEQPPGAVIRIERRDDPVNAVTEDDAARRAGAYPNLRVGAPLFGHAVDLGDGRWQVHALVDDAPQQARDTLASRLREQLADTADPDLAAELTATGQVLDWEKVDEVTVAGRRHRIVRADTFARFGPDGPEPPRPTDPDPREADRYESFLGGDDVIVDPDAPTGVAEAVLKVELLPAHYPRATVPADVYAQSVAAVRSHPNGVLLPTRYAVAEYVAGAWQPSSRAVATAQEARESIMFDFRWLIPRTGNPSEDEAAAYRQAADDLEASRADEVSVLGRRFRITRIETLLRFSSDGPEGPRPSDPDPDPPPEAHFAQLRAQGLLPDPDTPQEEHP